MVIGDYSVAPGSVCSWEGDPFDSAAMVNAHNRLVEAINLWNDMPLEDRFAFSESSWARENAVLILAGVYDKNPGLHPQIPGEMEVVADG